MSDFDPRSTRWLAGLVLLISGLALSIIGRLYHVSFTLGPDLVAAAREKVIQERDVPASRGNIYSSDGQLLATSMPVYEIRWDAAVVGDERMSSHVSETAKALALLLPERNASEWAGYLRQQFNAKRRYALIAKNLSYSHYRKVAQTPLFSGSKYKSGLIAEERFARLMPLGNLAERTIGYQRPDATAGLEASFHETLRGHDGRRWMQNLGGNQWKPMQSSFTDDPQNGKDIITTLDARMQDAAHRALLQALKKYGADHGCVVLMEVKTGKIRAMANLGKLSGDSVYSELRNYAVWEKTEPGSTFKVASVLIGLEDGTVDTSDIIDTSPGVYTIYGRNVNDSHRGGYGRISLGRSLELSSNTGIVKALYPKYAKNPEAFIDRMYQLGLADRSGIQIKGESLPHIPKPGDKDWYGTTLPWMFFGYGVLSTPLQTLTFYNAIANEGTMVAPSLWEATRDRGIVIDAYETQVLHPAIASKGNIDQIQDLLEKIVIRGTAKNIYTDSLSMAGKTGTCQLNYWDPESRGYQASFAGYFPADEPMYSCIVVINRPKINVGFYANIVAAPVFRDLAMAVYRMTPQEASPAAGYWADGIQKAQERHNRLQKQYRDAALQTLEAGKMPNLTGWAAADAIALLEEHGYAIKLRGHGRVIHATRQNKTIELQLG
ncbi:MAG: penicillin-binding transpeptidase domain-containing protein [Schleiferiaceae bacterium]|nr:penicillin-binding transpeptidase domain-containing protein [Schleiferiaceae bacterium]